MPFYEKGKVRIRYEETGSGFPLIDDRDIVVESNVAEGRIHVVTKVRAFDRTGVEMEALTAASVAALSLYDTAKAFDRSARIEGVRLLAKSGGKSGDYRAAG